MDWFETRDDIGRRCWRRWPYEIAIVWPAVDVRAYELRWYEGDGFNLRWELDLFDTLEEAKAIALAKYAVTRVEARGQA